jgi:antitoxin ParD1/3/4
MRAETLTITLPQPMAELIRQKVESGEFADESDVVISGLMALDSQDSADDEEEIEAWLRDEVVPIALRMQANPGTGYTSEEVMAHLEADLKASQVRTDAA